MPLAEFEPAIPGSERPRNHALEGAGTGIGCCLIWVWNLVAQNEGRTCAEGLREYGAGENKDDDVVGDKTELHNEELHNFYTH